MGRDRPKKDVVPREATSFSVIGGDSDHQTRVPPRQDSCLPWQYCIASRENERYTWTRDRKAGEQPGQRGLTATNTYLDTAELATDNADRETAGPRITRPTAGDNDEDDKFQSPFSASSPPLSSQTIT